MITFTGNVIHQMSLPAIDSNGKQRHRRVDFYELNPKSVNDNKLLERLVNHWGEEDTFIRVIEDNFKYNKYDEFAPIGERFFILAQRKPEIKDIRVNDVLAVAQTSTKKPKFGIEIDFLQTIPKQLLGQKEFKVQNIGSKFLEELKNLFYGKNIWLYSSESNIDFYRHNGFKKVAASKVGLAIMKYFHK